MDCCFPFFQGMKYRLLEDKPNPEVEKLYKCIQELSSQLSNADEKAEQCFAETLDKLVLNESYKIEKLVSQYEKKLQGLRDDGIMQLINGEIERKKIKLHEAADLMYMLGLKQIREARRTWDLSRRESGHLECYFAALTVQLNAYEQSIEDMERVVYFARHAALLKMSLIYDDASQIGHYMLCNIHEINKMSRVDKADDKDDEDKYVSLKSPCGTPRTPRRYMAE